MTTSVIEASALCRVFASEDGREPVRAVDGVTFAVPPEARLVALIGPDGAGKSTLMQMICGLVGQDSGSLSVLGRTPDPDDEDFVNAVGYMPQTLGLYKDLSVMENMKLFGALRGTKPPEGMTIEAYYASLIALTGLEGFEGRPAGKLSGGMKQKLALAVALVRAPALLLLDEPTVGVDPLSRRELWAVIRRMVGQGGTTCFFSTAYLEEAESADWVLCMSEGRIIGSGTPAELLGRTKGRTYALDLSGFSDAERKSLSRRMMLKVSPAPEKSVFLDAVPRDGGIDLLLNAPNTREFAEREVELALRRDETGTVPDFDVLERAPRMEDAYALLTFTMETVRADDAASSAAPDPDDPGRLDTGDVPIRARDLSRTFGSFVAVADTTFDVKRGEIFGLLGPQRRGQDHDLPHALRPSCAFGRRDRGRGLGSSRGQGRGARRDRLRRPEVLPLRQAHGRAEPALLRAKLRLLGSEAHPPRRRGDARLRAFGLQAHACQVAARGCEARFVDRLRASSPSEDPLS